MPTLHDVLSLYKGSNVFLNIELKGPLSDERKSQYDYALAARTVHAMVLEFDLQKQVMLSSFVPEIIEEMRICLMASREFMLCALLNRRN